MKALEIANLGVPRELTKVALAAVGAAANSGRSRSTLRRAIRRLADAHLGYGLPIGGVLATRNAVIPYAVGVDIACRMKLTLLDMPMVYKDIETVMAAQRGLVTPLARFEPRLVKLAPEGERPED